MNNHGFNEDDENVPTFTHGTWHVFAYFYAVSVVI